MGGNAFPNLKYMDRIHSNEISDTIKDLVDRLQINNFTYDYVFDNFLGSVGKQQTSGDIDIALNTKKSRFIGEPDLPIFDIREFYERTVEILGTHNVKKATLNGGQLPIAYPIYKTDRLVQIDLISGNPEWLKFTHYSPGQALSKFKGVYVSTTYKTIAYMNILYNEVDTMGNRIAKVHQLFDIDRGLYVAYYAKKSSKTPATVVSPDEFETLVPNAPRIPRIGVIDNPDAVIKLLLGENYSFNDVNTFEKLINICKTHYEDQTTYDLFCEKLIDGLLHSSSKHEIDVNELTRYITR